MAGVVYFVVALGCWPLFVHVGLRWGRFGPDEELYDYVVLCVIAAACAALWFVVLPCYALGRAVRAYWRRNLTKETP